MHFFFFQVADVIRYYKVTGVQTFFFFFSSRRRHTRLQGDWSSDVCSSDLDGKSRGSARLKRWKSRSRRRRTLPDEPGEGELGIGDPVIEYVSGDQLADSGPVLEPVARAAAHEPDGVGAGMTIDDEVLVRTLLVLANPRLEQRGAGEPGKAVPEVLARRAQPLRRRLSLPRGGIERRTARVVRHLKAPPPVAGDPVHEARAVVRPDGQGLLGEPRVARRRPEEEDLLARGAHQIADHVGEQATEPGARGEHVRVGAQHAPVRERDAAHRSRRHVPRSHGELAILAPLLEEPREHGLAREPGGQVAGVTLENRPAHFLAIDLGIPPCGLRAVQLLEREPGLLEDRQRRPLVLIVVLHEPQDADRVVELALPAPLLLAPQRERARGQDRVDAPWPVGPPDYARLAAGARARIARAPGVEQRDAGAPPPEMPGGPATERAGPHHDHVHSLSHCSGPPEPRARARGQSVP